MTTADKLREEAKSMRPAFPFHADALLLLAAAWDALADVADTELNYIGRDEVERVLDRIGRFAG